MRSDHVKDLLETDPDSLSTDELQDRIIELQLFRARVELARARVQAEVEARAEERERADRAEQAS